MKHFGITLTLIATLMLTACNNHNNPFLSEWDTPYGLPPFDQIEEDDYLPAIREGIAQQQAEIAAIVADTAAPTFANTIEAYEKSGSLLTRVVGVLFNIVETDGNDHLNAIVEEALPLISENSDNIFMNADLYKRVATIYAQKDSLQLTPEQATVLENMHRNFVRNGIALDADSQARLREINKQLSALEQKFGTNLLAENNAFQLLLDETDLAGLPEAVRTAAAEAATEAGHDGKYLITLHAPSRIPFLQYSQRRDLREQVYKAYINRGNNGNENDNNKIVLDIMRLRIEKAQLLGFDTPADFILEETMAKNAKAVDKFLGEIFEAANNCAKAERAELQALIDRDHGGFKLEAWDWDYYTELLRREKYALNEDEIKPYFQMERVREGAFACAHKLYGLNFEKLDSVPVYHPDVEAFKVTDADGSLIGLFYTDYYPRASKRGGAWMNDFRSQQNIDGNMVRPVVVNVGNFTKPTANTPSLLTIDEVETLFHEFGHALHSLLSQCHYPSVSGTNVPRDFVEMMSQINENWAFQPEVLAMYAHHYQTGEVIPDSLVEKINRSSKFNQGFATTELTAAAILDMKWHELTSIDDIDTQTFERVVMGEIGLIPEIAPRYTTTNFNHVFNNGYCAGYYSYLWAEVLDKDAFELFRQNGIFDEATARSFRTNCLEKGGSEDPMLLFTRFRGTQPNPDAMLRGRGLK